MRGERKVKYSQSARSVMAKLRCRIDYYEGHKISDPQIDEIQRRLSLLYKAVEFIKQNKTSEIKLEDFPELQLDRKLIYKRCFQLNA